MPPGATARPTSAVKITSDITRGFNSSKKSRADPMPPSGSAVAPNSLLAITLSDINHRYFHSPARSRGRLKEALRPGGPDRSVDHLIRGSSENWWNGGGEESVHSSVVAPSPHGLLAAFSLRMNACATP